MIEEAVFTVSDLQAGERIDKYLELRLEGISRSHIQRIIGEGNLFVNTKPVKAGYKTRSGDQVLFLLPELKEALILAQDIPLDILYEDDDLLIVNKPKGMVVHPAPGHYSGTLVNALMYHCRDSLSGINGGLRPGIVHRIDKDTTGSVIVCKNDMAHLSIAGQLKEHSIHRTYRAVVHGVLKEESGTVNAPVGRHEIHRKQMAVNPKHGREAVTHYQVLTYYGTYTYLECRLETGRTHQIRVHMQSIGHPVLGDPVYSDRKVPFTLQGQTLHAAVLGFRHPATGRWIEVEAPLPDYFNRLLRIL